MSSFQQAVKVLMACGLVAKISDPQKSSIECNKLLAGGTDYIFDNEFENLFFISIYNEVIKFHYKGDELTSSFDIVCNNLEQACQFACNLFSGEHLLTLETELSQKSQRSLSQLGLKTLVFGQFKGSISLIGGSQDVNLDQVKRLLHGIMFSQQEYDEVMAKFGNGFFVKNLGGLIIGQIYGFRPNEGTIAYSTNLDSVITAICQYYKTGKLPKFKEKTIDI